MGRVFNFVLALLLMQQVIASKICPANEVFKECGSACPSTCKNYKDGPQMCTAQCVSGCFCQEGYVRNEDDGSCCLESDCPATEEICQANEVFEECGTACPTTCKNYKDGPQMCTMQCVSGCFCQKGYVRNEADGSCCLESECPATEEICPANEVFNECGTACPLTCKNYKDGPQMCTDQCVPGCYCQEGYVRNDAGTCCLESECPATEEICPANEVFNECGSACPLTCDNYKSPPRFCTMQCVVGCQCAVGYVKNTAEDTCCLPRDCPAPQPVCPLNQEYNQCGSACPLTCENYKNPPTFCTKQCVVGCQCKKGYVKKSDGSCCLPSDCTSRKPTWTILPSIFRSFV